MYDTAIMFIEQRKQRNMYHLSETKQLSIITYILKTLNEKTLSTVNACELFNQLSCKFYFFPHDQSFEA